MTTTYSSTVQGGGISVQESVTRSGDSTVAAQIALPAGKSGTLTTRTDDNTGVVTVTAGHGITASDTVDVYWSTGRRYGVDVTATDSTTISIDLGAGDNLPASSTAVVICKQVTANVFIDGDNCKLVAVNFSIPGGGTSTKCRITFFDAVTGGGSAVGSGLDLTSNTPNITDIEGGATNGYTGNPILSLVASNGGTSAATLQIVAEQDATP
jgi:hypothetical protein